MQYSFDCVSTLVRPRNVNLFILIVWTMLVNTGSTMLGRGYALPAVEVPPAVSIKAFYHLLGRAWGIVPRTLVGLCHLSDFGRRVSKAFVSSRIRHSASNPLKGVLAGQMTGLPSRSETARR